jgi:hypothetical protein
MAVGLLGGTGNGCRTIYEGIKSALSAIGLRDLINPMTSNHGDALID